MFILNAHPDHNSALEYADEGMFNADSIHKAATYIAARPGYAVTPLVSLPGLASDVAVASIQVKDESARFGLGSFKALGGAYAVIRLVLEMAGKRLNRVVDMSNIEEEDVRAVAREIVVACATDGNHGRSVAQGAQVVGARSVIFVHAGVSEARIAAIEKLGAEIVRVQGNYDDSVAQATSTCEREGWMVVSDTSWPGYEYVPLLVMQGYTAMLTEAIEQLDAPPTHVFVQAGVGGIAAATAAFFYLTYGERRPQFVVVDPARAACLYESARLGARTRVADAGPTIMAMLECYEPSLVAWRILTRCADAFMTVDEDDAVNTMRLLAKPHEGDQPIVAGESGGVGLAGFLSAMRDPEIKVALGIDAESRIFVINTEGATDAALYERLVGQAPEEVLITR